MSTPSRELGARASVPRGFSSRGIRVRRPKHKPQREAQCPHCQSHNLEQLDGNTVCSDCGEVVAESNIVSEVQFGETASGAAVVQGALVGAGQSHARGDGGRYGHVREPREVSEANGREELRKQSNWHGLPEAVFDQAFNIYKLALNSNFVQGRMISVVAATCLYAACRRSKETMMLLIDFAEGIAVNVFRIGQTWSDLKKTLFLQDLRHQPVMEVEDLVARFVRKLEFGRDHKKITNDALLLLRRMKRDWMVTGRRPNGLIGACIILAARMNNYRRTVREVVYVTKVCDLTVAKRLQEFSRTGASTMTVEEFKKMGMRLKQSEPPAVYQRRELEARKRKLAELTDGTVDRNAPIPNLAEVAPLPRPGSESARSTQEPCQTRSPSATPVEPEPAPTAKKALTAGTRKRQKTRKDADGFTIPNLPAGPPVDPALLNEGEQPAEDAISIRSTSATPGPEDSDDPNAPRSKVGYPKGRKRTLPAPEWTEADLISEAELEKEMEQILTDPHNVMHAPDAVATASEEVERRSTELAQKLLRATSMEPEVRRIVSSDKEIAEEEFEDDAEVANCLLSPEERQIKEKIWVTHNEDWLRSQQAKLLKKTLDEAQGKKDDPNKKKKRRVTRKMGDGSLLRGQSVESAADAARLMLERHAKNPSKHLNYGNVERIFRRSESSSRAGSVAREGSVFSRAGSVLSQRAGSVARAGSRAREGSAAPHSRAGSSRETPIALDDEDDAAAGEYATPARTQSHSSKTPVEIPDDEGAANHGLATPDHTQANGLRVSQMAADKPADAEGGEGAAGQDAEGQGNEDEDEEEEEEEDDDELPEETWSDGAEDEDEEEDVERLAEDAGLGVDDEFGKGSEGGFSDAE